MNEAVPRVLAVVAGLALGFLFFGGLWWTLRKGLSSPRPALLFFGSMLLRSSAALAGVYLVGGGRWDRMLLYLLGFVTARLLVTWWTRPPAATAEARHATEP